MTLNLTIAREMVGGELLRLRKQRGFIALVLLAVIAPVVIAFGYDVIAHASDPAKHGPAGGLHNYSNMLVMLGLFMGPVAAILIGAEAGAGDLAAGVFRDNVLTGRSRTALFLARIPAALAVSLSVTGIGFLIGVAGTFAFAGGLSTPSASLILESAGWLALANGVVCVVAIGLGSLTGSRPGTITALLGWQLVLSPLLLGSTSLGSLRRPLLDAPMQFLRPGPANGAPSVAMSAGIAIVVLALWVFVVPSLGAWRMRTRDA
jgi:ABC-type transport system involved in multi-copper enzyme maturation permease subunit